MGTDSASSTQKGFEALLPKVLGAFRNNDPGKTGVIPQSVLGVVLRACAGSDVKTAEELSDGSVKELVEASRTGDGSEGVAYERLLRWLWVPDPKSGAKEQELALSHISAVAALLPHEQTSEAQGRRKELWKKWDINKNRKLSLAELEKGILDDLVTPEIQTFGGDAGDAKVVLRISKPAVSRAYAAARDVYQPGDPSAVEFMEFRPLLSLLAQYLGMLTVFASLDENSDKRVDLEEFCKALPELTRWGSFQVEPGQEEEVFKEASKGQERLLFDDFCKWVMRRNLAGISNEEFLDKKLSVSA